MLRCVREVVSIVLAVLVTAGCVAHGSKSSQQSRATPRGQVTVVWLSVDGLRHDYIQRSVAPTFARLEQEGAYTHQVIPIFPSLTFPNHIAQVTGVDAAHHGIVLNAFRDVTSGQTVSFPDSSELLRAEPIWVTAKRQGVRVATMAWPMSGAQTGPYRSDYFIEAFDQKETDEHRLDRAIGTLETDEATRRANPATPPPLRLVMNYASHVDTVGHRKGPDSPEVLQAVAGLDASLAPFLRSLTTWFDRAHPDPDDELCLLITTDHGMEPCHTSINLRRLLGVPLIEGIDISESGPVACIYFTSVKPSDQQALAERMLEKLRAHPFISAWKSDQVPARLKFDEPTGRTGNIVVLLAPGYTFGSSRVATSQPTDVIGPRGMHGYDPAVCPNMLGSAIVWRYRHPIGGIDLGPVDNTQWHATVARLLGIEPAAGTDTRAIDVKSLLASPAQQVKVDTR